MRFSLEDLAVLDAIARRGSFAAAAEELHRVPSSVTYAVKNLEQSLGFPVFVRQWRRALLTPAGETLLEEGRALLHQAQEVGRRVERVAGGWESELCIAVTDLIPQPRLFPLIREFETVSAQTRLRLSTEVFGGVWDALLEGRADLGVGAPGDIPPTAGCAVQPLGEASFLFVVASRHPLASHPEPIPERVIRLHQAVAAADSSRHLPARTTRLLPGQQVLTVGDQSAKRAAILAGLGIGHLPSHMIQADLAAGRLVAKALEGDGVALHNLVVAWRSGHRGKALAWFRARLAEMGPELLAAGPP